VIEGWRAYNITSDRSAGIGSWSDRDLAQYFALGDGAHGAAAGPMGEAVEYSLSYLSDSDIAAIIVYLRSVQPVPSNIPAANPRFADGGSSNASQIPADGELDRLHGDPGMRMFAMACTGCHGWDGRGIADTRAVNDPQAINLTQVVLGGIELSARGRDVSMPEFGKAYTDPEIAALANYVTGRFGIAPTKLKPGDVAKRRNGD
jgi:mono/diheme cytochrome c family protein